MFDGAMVDLARTPEDVKEDIAEMAFPTSTSAKASGPKYPYGLCICLEDETLEKLGLDGDLPQVGEMIAIRGLARVTCASETERESTAGETEKCRRVELQITHLGVPPSDPAEKAVQASKARQKRFYADGEPDGDEA